MDYQGLKVFILYDPRPQTNYQFVMIRTLAIVEHATRETIAKDLEYSNPNTETDFRRVPVYEDLANRGIVKESTGMFFLIDFEKLTADQKKMLVKLCSDRIKDVDEKTAPEPDYWKISPGEKAEDWERQKQMSITAIGWNELGDLSGKKFGEVHEIIREKFGSHIGSVSAQFKNFLSIKKGDIIVANNGKSKIMGIGKVTGEYQYRPKEKYNHVYPVEWFYTKEKEIQFQSNWFVTVVPILPDIFKQIISDGYQKSSKTQIEPKLEELIVKFDENRKLFSEDWKSEQEINDEQQEFVTQFPIEKISEIQLDEYVQGKPTPLTGEPNRTTFCYLLENGLWSFGSGAGGDSSKFGIYFSKKRKEYEFDSLKFKTVEEAFSSLKEELKSILDVGKDVQNDGNWENLSKAIDDGDFQISRHVISKILAIYYPDTFVSIHSNAAINTSLDFFKVPRKEIEDKFQLKKSILNEIKDKHPIMKNWILQDYSHFLWNAIVKPVKLPERVNVKVISISKGSSKPGCELTNSCYSPNVIKIEVGDVVTWKNDDDSIHNISSGRPSKGPAGIFNCEQIPPNEVFSHQFEKDGTFQYFDTIHPWMTGEIIVGNQEIISEEIEHTSLKFPSKEKLEEGVRKISEDLLIDPETIKEIVINLASGRHILLAGPIGTGKTQLALKIPKTFWTENNGYYPELHTATSEWSTNDVIGGIMPKMKGDKPIYEIQLGCVSKTVKSNWDEDNPSRRILPTHEDKTFHGTWLVIDEFNRADIDKAIGQLFTSLETRILKIPTSKEKETFEEVVIPMDYRIIGTLNTADKHYLFKLSDALKRRFAYIEVQPPIIQQKNQEIFFAMKNAIKEFVDEDFKELVILDKENKIISSNSNGEFLKRVEFAYDILSFIRQFKSLGTAVLKSIYQTLLVGSKITGDFDRSLDSAINVNLIPQLENTQITSLQVISEYLFGKPIEFFENKSKSNTFTERYESEFRITLEFLNIEKIQQRIEEYKKGKIPEDVLTSIQNKYDTVKLNVVLPMFQTSLTELIKISSIL